MSRPDPRELSTKDGFALLDSLAGFGAPLPHLVLTGGDPLKRAELFDFVAHARRLGFAVSVTPAGTPLLTQEVVRRMGRAEVRMMALSLDGSNPRRHDSLRGVPGSFARTVQAAGWAREADLPVQINTLVCAETIDDLPATLAKLTDLGISTWALFFLIQVGRGEVLQGVTTEESEEVMSWAHDVSKDIAFPIRTTEAPHYRRLVMQREKATRRDGGRPGESRHVRRGFGVRDGAGIMFISHRGEVYPSGFLPLTAGRVPDDDPVEVYRRSPLFRSLRDPEQLKGKCGVCEYRRICGGSRARAYTAMGDPLESDPLCPYEPGRTGAKLVSPGPA
jgi:radical SAM protein